MSVFEFDDPIPVETPLGDGFALFVETSAHDNWWTVAISETCALVTFEQARIRIHKSYTHCRGITDEVMKKITARG